MGDRIDLSRAAQVAQKKPDREQSMDWIKRLAKIIGELEGLNDGLRTTQTDAVEAYKDPAVQKVIADLLKVGSDLSQLIGDMAQGVRRRCINCDARISEKRMKQYAPGGVQTCSKECRRTGPTHRGARA